MFEYRVSGSILSYMLLFMRLTSWLLIFLFWPISLVRQNSFNSLTPILLCLLIFTISYVLRQSKDRYHYFLYLVLPIINVNLLLFPLFYGLFNVRYLKKDCLGQIYLILSIVLLFALFTKFLDKSIFAYGELDIYNLNLKRGLLGYGILARSLYNKAWLFLNKILSNFFSLTDINNYFFAFHPRESVLTNQNLVKYSFSTLPYFVVGMFNIRKFKMSSWYITCLISLIFSLSFLKNFDINDFVPWLFLSLICVNGYKITVKKPNCLTYLLFFAFLSLSFWQLLRLFVL